MAEPAQAYSKSEYRASPVDTLATLVAESIDRLVTLDVSGYGIIGPLHQAVRAHYGRPATLVAADSLMNACRDGGDVFITTGWTLPGMYPYGETDGPVGAALLGRSLQRAFGARPVLLTEPWLVPMVAAGCRAAGLNVLSEEDIEASPQKMHPRNPCCLVIPLCVEEARENSEAQRLFDVYRPKAMVAIEKSGPNRGGQYAMVNGFDNSDLVAKAGLLFEKAQAAKVLSIGIGDRGNEIGFAAIADVPRRILPFGEDATNETAVDVLVVAAISNWGASGIEACLALRLDRPDLLHTPDLEQRVIEACVAAGAYDGFSCRPEPSVDGMPLGVQVAVITLLNEIIRAPAARGVSLFSTPIFKQTRASGEADDVR